jgi:translocation and assembly module TamB
VLRRPVPAETPVPGEDQPLLPELPVKVEIKEFRLAELVLGEPLLGTAARVTASGRARLGNPAEGLDLTLDARRPRFSRHARRPAQPCSAGGAARADLARR